MQMEQCPFCGRMVITDTPECPGCGEYLPLDRIREEENLFFMDDVGMM